MSKEMQIKHLGRTQTYKQWARELGWSAITLRNAMRRNGTLPPAKTFRTVAMDGAWEQDVEAQRLVAERGPMTLQEIADHMGVTRERVRQIECAAMRKLARTAPHLERRLREIESEREERLAMCGSKWVMAV